MRCRAADDAELGGHDVQPFRDILTDAMQTAAAGAGEAVRFDDLFDARPPLTVCKQTVAGQRVLGQRPTIGDTRPGDTRLGDTRPGDTRPGDTRLGGALGSPILGILFGMDPRHGRFQIFQRQFELVRTDLLRPTSEHCLLEGRDQLF